MGSVIPPNWASRANEHLIMKKEKKRIKVEKKVKFEKKLKFEKKIKG